MVKNIGTLLRLEASQLSRTRLFRGKRIGSVWVKWLSNVESLNGGRGKMGGRTGTSRSRECLLQIRVSLRIFEWWTFDVRPRWFTGGKYCLYKCNCQIVIYSGKYCLYSVIVKSWFTGGNATKSTKPTFVFIAKARDQTFVSLRTLHYTVRSIECLV